MTRRKPIPPLTDAEQAEIQAQIAADPDDRELTDEEIAQAKPFAEVFPELAASIARARVRPRVEHPKTAVTPRLDHRPLRNFKRRAATGAPAWSKPCAGRPTNDRPHHPPLRLH